MAIDTTVWAGDLAAMVSDLPTAAQFGATQFQCSAAELSTEETLVLCGNNTKRAVWVTFPSSAFTVGATFKPQSRLQLKYPDASAFSNYEIVDIKISADLVGYTVLLKQDNRTV